MRPFLRLLKNFLLKNWGLKLTSILIAFALWIMVRGSIGEQVFTVPLTYNLPSGMVIVGERPPSFVDVTAQGYLAGLGSGQPIQSYDLDLRSYGEGLQVIELTPDGVRLGPTSGLRVIRINPQVIRVVLEKLIEKKYIPVDVRYSGEPADGLELYKLTAMPDNIDISGPHSVVDPIQVLETLPVQLDGRRVSYDTQANLKIPSDDIHTSPVAVVKVAVLLGPPREVVPIRIPVEVLDGEDFTVSPPNVTVNLKVPVTYKGTLTADDFKATVSVAGLDPSVTRTTVSPVVIPGTDLIPEIDWSISPETVTITRISRKK